MPITENTWPNCAPWKRSRNSVCVATEPTAAPKAAMAWASSKPLNVLTLKASSVAATYNPSPANITGRRPQRSHNRPHTTTPSANARKYTDRVCPARSGPTAKAWPISPRAGL